MKPIYMKLKESKDPEQIAKNGIAKIAEYYNANMAHKADETKNKEKSIFISDTARHIKIAEQSEDPIQAYKLLKEYLQICRVKAKRYHKGEADKEFFTKLGYIIATNFGPGTRSNWEKSLDTLLEKLDKLDGILYATPTTKATFSR